MVSSNLRSQPSSKDSAEPFTQEIDYRRADLDIFPKGSITVLAGNRTAVAQPTTSHFTYMVHEGPVKIFKQFHDLPFRKI
jgi:hypothetical protein